MTKLFVVMVMFRASIVSKIIHIFHPKFGQMRALVVIESMDLRQVCESCPPIQLVIATPTQVGLSLVIFHCTIASYYVVDSRAAYFT